MADQAGPGGEDPQRTEIHTFLIVTDPHAAGEEWAKVDRAVVRQAPWVTLFNPTGIDLVSRRVKNYQHNPEFGLLVDQLWVK